VFNRLINIGITNNLNGYQKRETRILNIISLIIFIGLLIGATNIFFIGSLYPYIFTILVAIGTASILVLNHLRKYNAALYSFIITLICALIYASNYYPRSVGTMVYFFPVIFCVALIHNPNKPKHHLPLQFGLVFFGFFISQFKQLPFIQPGDFSSEQLSILRYYNLYVSILVTIVMVFLVVKQSNKHYHELNSLIHKLEDNQVLISSSLKEKEILLAEVQHRVKNNLAVIIALFKFQQDNSTNEETKIDLNEARNRVLSIAMVHEQLYKKDDLSKIDLEIYLSELLREILRSHPIYSNAIIRTQIANITLDITKTIPVGLIVNEVLTNSLKHGFKSLNKTPEIEVSIALANDIISVKMKDNGIGFPEHLEKNNNSLGISLIESLTEQIEGKLTLSNNNGAQVEFSFHI
jgi:two-component sensor histidine kinase